MRTIKFRGKNLKGQWHYGLLCHDKTKDSDYEWFISNSAGKPYAFGAIPETIGQFTGLHDKNGKEIYEDDLLGYWTKDVNKKDKLLLCRVSFRNGAFVADVSKNLDGKLFTDLSSYLDKYIVIGNIYENADLLERSAKADA